MGTLTINGRSVTVDDSFANLSPADQEKTVNEIASQMGAQSQPSVLPGQTVNDQPPVTSQPQASSPNLLNSTAATLQGITGSIPFLNQAGDLLTAGGQTIGDILANRPGTVSQHYADLQQQRQQIAQKAPIANALGGLAGMTGFTAGLGALPGGLEAMGMEGNFGKQLFNSMASMTGYEGLQGLSKGHTGGQLLLDEGAGAGSGALGSLLGQGISGIGDAFSRKATQAAQNQLVDSAAVGSGDLAANASGLFQSSVDNNPLQITSDSYHQLLSDVGNGLQKFRPNSDSNQPVTGLLQKLYGIADDLNTPGSNVAVDLKDLHIFRQEANDIAQQGGQNGLMGKIVVNKIDNFVRGLKPGDIAGGADPSQATSDLMQAISDWSKAKKIDILQDAVDHAQTLPSDPADNLKRAFRNLMRSDDFNRFSPAEQSQIRQVAQGTTGQNIASFFGKLGIQPTGGPTHMVGGGLGTSALTMAGVPFPLSLAATSAAGYTGRNLAQDAANNSVQQAMRAVTAGNVPLAATAPNLLAPVGSAVNMGIRSGGPALVRSILPALAGG